MNDTTVKNTKPHSHPPFPAANSVYTAKQNIKRKSVFYWPPYKTPNRWRCWTPMRHPVAPRSLADPVVVLTLDYIRTNKCFGILPTQRRGVKTWIVWLRLLIFVGCTLWPRISFLSHFSSCRTTVQVAYSSATVSALEILCRTWFRVATRNTVQVAYFSATVSILGVFALGYVSH